MHNNKDIKHAFLRCQNPSINYLPKRSPTKEKKIFSAEGVFVGQKKKSRKKKI